MSALSSSTGRQPEWGLLLLRLVVGGVMFYAGWMKMFGMGPGAVGEFLAAEGVPFKEVSGYALCLLELIGGASIILGLFARLFALLLTIDMIFAILLVSVEIGFMSPDGHAGAEVNLLLIGGYLAILFCGPGSISLDAKLEKGSQPAV